MSVPATPKRGRASVAKRQKAQQKRPVDAKDATDAKKPSFRERLIALASDIELFISTDSEAFGTFRDPRGRQRTVPLRSPEFRAFLSKRYLDGAGGVPPRAALDEAIEQLDGRTRLNGETPIKVFRRVGSTDGAVYLDLGNADYDVVEITAASWQIIKDPPVKFRRSDTMLPLPFPERGGSLDALRPFLNVRDEDWPKVVGFLVGAVKPSGPYPLFEVVGEHGSAKSSVCMFMQRMVDPIDGDERSAPSDERNLAIALRDMWLPCCRSLKTDQEIAVLLTEN